jgi:hypothetical protein
LRIAPVLLLVLALSVFASGLESYYVPGVETGEVLISVHIWGEVRTPGTFQIPVGSDLVVALSAAGGPVSTADLDKVKVVEGDTEVEYSLSEFLEAEGEPLPVLGPGATVYVPERGFEGWKEVIDFGYKILVAVNLVWLMTER